MASDMAAQIGSRIAEARNAKGISQKQLGQALPGIVGGDQINKWERGQHRVGDDTLSHIATALDVDYAYFFTAAPTGDTPDLLAEDDQLDRIEHKLDTILRSLPATDEQLAAELQAELQAADDEQADKSADSSEASPPAPGRRRR